MKIMNKKDLINVVVEKTGLTKKDVTLALESTLDEITSALANGDSVQLIGFGGFSVSKRKERQGLNPKLLADLKEQGVDADSAKIQAAITIEASSVPKFKAGSKLKESVNH